MRINFDVDFSKVRSDADVRRQAEWRDKSVQPIKARRSKRLQLLEQKSAAIKRATDAYVVLDDGNVPWIGLRSGFIALDPSRSTPATDEREPVAVEPDEADRQRRRKLMGRPPLTRVAHRKSNALSLYLTAVYVAHQEVKAGGAFINTRRNLYRTKDGQSGWIWLSGLSVPKEEHARRTRLRRALDQLVDAGLVNIDTPGTPGRYERWTLLADDGTSSVYRVPSEREPGSVRLPASFFYNGWHLALEPGEITMLLAIMHRCRWIGNESFWASLPLYVKRGTYGLSGEMYLHAQQLVEFELVEFRDPMPNRRRGKIRPPAADPAEGSTKPADEEAEGEKFAPVPYEFRPADLSVFNQKAEDVVRRTLTALPVPHRLDADGTNIAPQDYVEQRLAAKESKRFW